VCAGLLQEAFVGALCLCSYQVELISEHLGKQFLLIRALYKNDSGGVKEWSLVGSALIAEHEA